MQDLGTNRIMPAKLAAPTVAYSSKLPAKKPSLRKASGSLTKKAGSSASNGSVSGKMGQPRQSTLQFQPRQSTLQFLSSSVKPANESTSGSTPSNDQKVVVFGSYRIALRPNHLVFL